MGSTSTGSTACSSTAAAFTNLTQDHLDYHADMAPTSRPSCACSTRPAAAGRHRRWSTPTATAPRAHRPRAERAAAPLTFGMPRPHFQLLSETPTPTGQQLVLGLFGAHHEAELPLAGGFQAENVLAALGLVIGTGGDAGSAP